MKIDQFQNRFLECNLYCLHNFEEPNKNINPPTIYIIQGCKISLMSVNSTTLLYSRYIINAPKNAIIAPQYLKIFDNGLAMIKGGILKNINQFFLNLSKGQLLCKIRSITVKDMFNVQNHFLRKI